MFVRASALACLVLLGIPQVAGAQAEIRITNPIGLGWTGCSSANPVGEQDVGFACQNETVDACRVFRLMPTFVSSITDPAFLGSAISIDVLIGASPVIGQWWADLPWLGCRPPVLTTAGNITAASLPTAGGCRNPYPAGTVTLPGQQNSGPGVGAGPLPNRFRISSANSHTPPYLAQPLTTGERTYAMQLEFKTEGTLANCDPTVDPTPVCTDGCLTPACFVLNMVEVGSGNPNPDIIHYTSDGTTRNFVTYQGGTGSNCPGATPTRPATWGAIKALYR